MADKDTAQLLNQLRGTPIGDRILNYLAQRNAMPAIEQSYLGDAVSGSFSYGDDFKDPGTIKYAASRSPVGMTNTLLHELTHAADRQITKDAFEYMRSDPQLYDAWMKLSGRLPRQAFSGQPVNAREAREEMAYRINPSWYDTNNAYRASNTELPAWGVSNAAIPSVYDSAPQHLNATLAQEFDILLDLASRAKKKK